MSMNPNKVIIPCRFSYLHCWEPDSVNAAIPNTAYRPSSPRATHGPWRRSGRPSRMPRRNPLQMGWQDPPEPEAALRDGDIERPDDEAYAGSWFLNANSRQAPEVVDRKVQRILDQSEVYSGCYGQISVTFYGFNTNGNRASRRGWATSRSSAMASRWAARPTPRRNLRLTTMTISSPDWPRGGGETLPPDQNTNAEKTSARRWLQCPSSASTSKRTAKSTCPNAGYTPMRNIPALRSSSSPMPSMMRKTQVVDLKSGERLPPRVLDALDRPGHHQDGLQRGVRAYLYRPLSRKASGCRAVAVYRRAVGDAARCRCRWRAWAKCWASSAKSSKRAATSCATSRCLQAHQGQRPAHAQPAGTRPGEWQRFKEYCVRDVEAEREIRAKVQGYPSPRRNRNCTVWIRRINDRGVMSIPCW